MFDLLRQASSWWLPKPEDRKESSAEAVPVEVAEVLKHAATGEVIEPESTPKPPKTKERARSKPKSTARAPVRKAKVQPKAKLSRSTQAEPTKATVSAPPAPEPGNWVWPSSRQCKWIDGDPKRHGEWSWCLEPVKGSGVPYCPAHTKRAFAPHRPR